jgi:hypothetical protein
VSVEDRVRRADALWVVGGPGTPGSVLGVVSLICGDLVSDTPRARADGNTRAACMRRCPDTERAIRRRAGAHEHRVAALLQLREGDVAADLAIPGEREALGTRRALEHPGDGLDLRALGRDAGGHEPHGVGSRSNISTEATRSECTPADSRYPVA